MQCLIIEPSAEEDLDEIWESGLPGAEDVVATIEVLLEEIASDRDFLARMHQPHVRRLDEPSADTDRVIGLWKAGYNILRLKVWDNGALVPYRVIYAYDPRHDAFHVLAIAPRENCYDDKHPRTQRILRDYYSLGIPAFGK